MARPRLSQAKVKAARQEACFAVDLYNGPEAPRSIEAFVVHMHLAWLMLLHAEMDRDGVDYRYWKSVRKLDYVEGQPKTWDLQKCVRERWPDQSSPVRANLDFFIRLRNMIEHRPALTSVPPALARAGHSQALLRIFGRELLDQFGRPYSLAATLRLPIYVGTFTDEG